MNIVVHDSNMNTETQIRGSQHLANLGSLSKISNQTPRKKGKFLSMKSGF